MQGAIKLMPHHRHSDAGAADGDVPSHRCSGSGWGIPGIFHSRPPKAPVKAAHRLFHARRRRLSMGRRRRQSRWPWLPEAAGGRPPKAADGGIDGVDAANRKFASPQCGFLIHSLAAHMTPNHSSVTSRRKNEAQARRADQRLVTQVRHDQPPRGGRAEEAGRLPAGRRARPRPGRGFSGGAARAPGSDGGGKVTRDVGAGGRGVVCLYYRIGEGKAGSANSAGLAGDKAGKNKKNGKGL